MEIKNDILVEQVGLEQLCHAISANHVGPFPLLNRYKYSLTITDITSKHMTLYPQKEVAANETLIKLTPRTTRIIVNHKL